VAVHQVLNSRRVARFWGLDHQPDAYLAVCVGTERDGGEFVDLISDLLVNVVQLKVPAIQQPSGSALCNVASISATVTRTDLPRPNGVTCATKLNYILQSILEKQGKARAIKIDTNLTRGTCYCKLERNEQNTRALKNASSSETKREEP
jgi:hypothetical protein